MPRRILPLAATLIALVALAAPAAAQDGGMVGGDLKTVARDSDFFTFFNLRPEGTAEGPSGPVSVWRTGGDFRDLVRVEVRAAAGRIAGMALVVRRAFLDDPANGIFARDIVQSFLSQAPPADEAALLAGLAERIREIPSGGAAAKPLPELDVLLGRADAPVSRPLGTTRLTVEPVMDDGAPAVRLAVERP